MLIVLDTNCLIQILPKKAAHRGSSTPFCKERLLWRSPMKLSLNTNKYLIPFLTATH